MPDCSASPVDFRAFWGKASPGAGGSLAFHPVAWHGLDVAAVFQRILMVWPDQADALASAFDGSADLAISALCTLVALHDLGKFAWTFQAKVEAVYPACLGPWQPPPPCNHSAIGYGMAEDDRYLSSAIEDLVGPVNVLRREAILGPIFGHHGRPVDPEDALLDRHARGPNGPTAQAARAYIEAVSALFGYPRLPAIRRDSVRSFSWRFAGLVALADWIGSNQDHFHYSLADLDMVAYWTELAQKRAEAAVLASGLEPSSPSSDRSLDIVCSAAYTPTAAQMWAQSVGLPETGGLFILEDVMGSGKTEAALILAHRLMQAGRAGGLYVALPTMATANGLYHRLHESYRALFAESGRPSLILAHGARDLDDRFRRSIGLEGAPDPASPCYGDDPADETATAACARWLADDRRKVFLADVGVGTIDQALLAVLPVKHACIRQIGLARRVLVIDEAHAYDSYMQGEIETLVSLQARMGAPVIVLSATLPRPVRNRLLAAYAAGGGRTAPEGTATAYPLATVLGAELTETPLAARPDLVRRVVVSRCPDEAAAEAAIVAAARRGATVAYIRNTVDDAVETAGRLGAEGVAVTLFHARFAMGDRLEIEGRVVAEFGRDSRPDGRRGRVLVATQVAEQSLDFDVDLMVTDLAPVDLVLQRAGRLWRHPRDGRGWPHPELLVVSPEPEMGAGRDWYAGAFPRGQWVYRDHALLWLGARDLLNGEPLALPGDLRRLVEAVYVEDALDQVPPALLDSGYAAIGEARAGRTMVRLNVLDLEGGYVPQSGEWGPDTVTPTRLGDERDLLRLARIVNGRIVPWRSDPDPRRAWALSELSVRRGRFQSRAGLSAEIEAQAEAIDQDWAEHHIPARILPLFPEGEGWSFAYRNKGGVEKTATYSPMAGLRWG